MRCGTGKEWVPGAIGAVGTAGLRCGKNECFPLALPSLLIPKIELNCGLCCMISLPLKNENRRNNCNGNDDVSCVTGSSKQAFVTGSTAESVALSTLGTGFLSRA